MIQKRWTDEEGFEYYCCTLCGNKTNENAGSTDPDWVLCDDCAGTPEAEAAGYAHYEATE